tara:strand:+ start:778 stop:1614 length:837 start_codon:yes stop_codon:yes gene_type:complete
MTYMKLVLSVVAVAGLGSLPTAAQELKTAVDATFAPHAMVTLGGGVQGFNVDLGHAFADRLGREIDIEGTEFSGIIPGLNAGKYDFVLAPVTATPERAKVMLFTEGYLDTDFTFIEKNAAPGIKSLADLKNKTIALNKGSSYESWARENAEKYGFKFDVYGTNADAVQAVQSGRADAGLAGNGVSGWVAKQNPEIKTTLTIPTGLVWSIAFRLDDHEGRDTFSMVLKCMKKEGVVAELVEKWFGFTPGPESAAIKIAPGHGIPGMDGYDPTPITPVCS